MLLWFRCKNCYSFADNGDEDKGVGIAMIASDQPNLKVPDDYEEPEYSYSIIRNGLHIRQVTSIYGANGSGKSNIFKAITSMFENISGIGCKLNGEPFTRDGTLKDKPIVCEISFCLPSELGYDEYRYGYEITDKSILTEWLTKRILGTNDNFEDIFFREGNNIRFGKGDYATVEPFKATLEQSTDILFLRLAGRTRVEPFSKIYKWCLSSIPPNIFSDEGMKRQIEAVAERIEKDENFRLEFLDFLKKFDPCVEDVITTDTMPDMTLSLLIKQTVHNAPEGTKPYRYVSIFRESHGTQRIASIYLLLADAWNKGGLVLVDELDMRLHPHVLRELIKRFRHKDNKSAQLIFSSHNTATLNSRNMRSDEIYFVKKDNKGHSIINRLSDYTHNGKKLRLDMHFDEMYLSGRFGAIPEEFVL